MKIRIPSPLCDGVPLILELTPPSYKLTREGEDEPIFDDTGFRPGAGMDEATAAYSLVGFLTSSPFDTDADYFKLYTLKQREWSASQECECLNGEANEAEQEHKTFEELGWEIVLPPVLANRVSYSDILSAAFVVADGWYGGMWSPSYAFQCGSLFGDDKLDLDEEVVWDMVSGTLDGLKSCWKPKKDPEIKTEKEFQTFYELDDSAWCDYLSCVETLERAVENGWYRDEAHKHFIDPPKEDEDENDITDDSRIVGSYAPRLRDSGTG